jgi:hypothetical protein
MKIFRTFRKDMGTPCVRRKDWPRPGRHAQRQKPTDRRSQNARQAILKKVPKGTFFLFPVLFLEVMTQKGGFSRKGSLGKSSNPAGCRNPDTSLLPD